VKGTSRIASSLSSSGTGRNQRRAATRDASLRANGSSAPSCGRRDGFTVFAAAALALTGLVLFAAPAFASKEIKDYFGTTDFNSNADNAVGGEFQQPRDIAVNRTGNGPGNPGDIYVADDNNNRIQRFDNEGNFVAAWGANVLTVPANEVQTLTVSATAGTHTLSFAGATTGNLAFNATAATVQTALRALPSVNGANLTVSGTAPYTITFNNSLSATNVPQLAVDDSLLTGTAALATTTQGSGQYEVCVVAANCRGGSATGGANAGNTAKNGSLDNPQSVAVDNDTGDVYVSDRDNFRVNQYTGDGTFIRSFGFGVDAAVAGDGYEVCPAANRCKSGLAGAGAGQVGATTTAGTLGIAVSQANGEAAVGTVFLADSQNRRVNTYALDGTSPSSFGSATQFGTVNPRMIEVDSRGIVYASDSNSANQIDRYDTLGVNGPVGFIASIASPPLLAGPASTATSGLAVDPDSDGVGSDEDVLYVLRDPTAGNTVVQQFGPTNDPGLSAAPVAVDDTHGAGAGFTTVNGLGLNDSSGELLVTASSNLVGDGGFARVFILDDNVAPSVTLDPVTVFDAHSATLTGSVNPNGFHATYRFEYVDDAEYLSNEFANAQRIPIATNLYTQIGNGTSPLALEHELPAHLIPGTTYHVRLVAGQVSSPTTTISGEQTFTTDDSAPTITGTAATISTDEATLRGAINPEDEAVTNYHFKWGTSEAYGNTTPVGNLASGNESVAVIEELTGLAPGTTYHYQLVTTNGTGTTTEPDQTFTTLAEEPKLGPERGYEMVSHYPSGGVPLYPTATSPSVDLGDEVIYKTYQAAPGSVSPIPDHINFSEWLYKSVRGPAGWEVHQIPLTRTIAGRTADSLDLSHELFTTTTGLDPDDQNGTADMYLRQPDGAYTWISRDPRIPVGTPQTEGGPGKSTEFGGGSEAEGWRWMSYDGNTVVFLSHRSLDDADPGGGNNASYAYKWQNGQLKFLGIRPDESVPAVVVGGSARTVAISKSGSRVAWVAYRDNGESRFRGGRSIYVQVDGQPNSIEAVKETGVPMLLGPQPWNIGYEGGDKNLTRIFFSSASRLTPDSGAGGNPAEGPERTSPSSSDADLYVYDVAADKVRDLTPRLDGITDSTVDPATGDRGRLGEVKAVSDDGKRVYFTANAAYDVAPNPFGQLPTEGGPNLYFAELDGIDDPIKLRFVAPTSPFGEQSDANPDGSVFSFGASQSLTGQPIGGLLQLFVYDAERDTLECASCPPDGSLPADEVNRYPLDPNGFQYGYRFKRNDAFTRWTASDGRVFFDSVGPLTPDDQNTTEDVYEYRNGEVRLISGGTGSNPSKIENVSVDGSSVFFTSFDALAPQDKEPGTVKLYVAREGGGFELQPELPPCDANAGACEGAGTSAPDLAGAGSAKFSGPGDIEESQQDRCKRLARAAKKLASRARRLREAARGAGDPQRAEALRRKARRFQKAAGKRSVATKRCRRSAARAANTNRRAGR
jgi:hypothetical protein